jgi:hypothetical protein
MADTLSENRQEPALMSTHSSGDMNIWCILQELNTMLIDTPRRLLSLPGDKDALS